MSRSPAFTGLASTSATRPASFGVGSAACDGGSSSGSVSRAAGSAACAASLACCAPLVLGTLLGYAFMTQLGIGVMTSTLPVLATGPTDSPASVPLKITGQGPVVEVKINGQGPFTFLIATHIESVAVERQVGGVRGGFPGEDQLLPDGGDGFPTLREQDEDPVFLPVRQFIPGVQAMVQFAEAEVSRGGVTGRTGSQPLLGQQVQFGWSLCGTG